MATILIVAVTVLLIRSAGCVDIMMGNAMTRDLNDGYIVSPGYPMVLTEAMRVRCQLRKISTNPTTVVTLTKDHIDLFDARGHCRERMEINFYPDRTQNRLFCSSQEDTFGSTYTLETNNNKIDIDFNKCDSLQGGQFRFQFTGSYNVRVQCFDRQDPDPYNCPTIATTTTQSTTTEVQQQTTTTQHTSRNNTSTGNGSNGENTEPESSDRANLYIIIGGVVGGALLICIIIVLVVCLLLGRDNKQKEAPVVISQGNGTAENLYENVSSTQSNGQATVDPEKGQAKYSSSATETENKDSEPQMYAQVDKSRKSRGSRNHQDASVGD